MTSMGKRALEFAAEVRERNPAGKCYVLDRTGDHNWIDARHWFRNYRTCASCGHVERAQ